MCEMGDKLETRLAELIQARERYAADAQRQIGAFDGAIGELRRLIEELAEGKEENDAADSS